MNMVRPGIMMMENMNKGTPIPMLDMLADATDEIAMLYSLFTGYEGGSYCQGLIFSHEVAKLALTYGKQAFSNQFAILKDDQFLN